jgi:hypothetical protein
VAKVLRFFLADGGRSPSYILRLAWLHGLSTLTSLFIIFLQRSYVRTSLLVSAFPCLFTYSEVLDFGHSENLSYFESRLPAVP